MFNLIKLSLIKSCIHEINHHEVPMFIWFNITQNLKSRLTYLTESVLENTLTSNKSDK